MGDYRHSPPGSILFPLWGFGLGASLRGIWARAYKVFLITSAVRCLLFSAWWWSCGDQGDRARPAAEFAIPDCRFSLSTVHGPTRLGLLLCYYILLIYDKWLIAWFLFFTDRVFYFRRRCGSQWCGCCNFRNGGPSVLLYSRLHCLRFCKQDSGRPESRGQNAMYPEIGTLKGGRNAIYPEIIQGSPNLK